MNPEPQLNLTPYSVMLAVVAVVGILASPLASSVVSPQLQNLCALLSVVLPAVMAVVFTSVRLATKVSTFFTRKRHDG